jgi:hypothetical protein
VRVALRGSLLIASKPRNPARLEMKSLANRMAQTPFSVCPVADVHRELLLNRKEACQMEDDRVARWLVYHNATASDRARRSAES